MIKIKEYPDVIQQGTYTATVYEEYTGLKDTGEEDIVYLDSLSIPETGDNFIDTNRLLWFIMAVENRSCCFSSKKYKPGYRLFSKNYIVKVKELGKIYNIPMELVMEQCQYLEYCFGGWAILNKDAILRHPDFIEQYRKLHGRGFTGDPIPGSLLIKYERV